MTAAILWKEYRQQRGVWLAMVVIAFMIAAVLYLLIGEEQGWHRFREDRPIILSGLLVTLAAFQGLLAGVLLFAEESESRTAAFLDQLTGNRSVIFRRKLLAGLLLVVSLALVLIPLDLTLGVANRSLRFGNGPGYSPPYILGMAVDALIWGILAGVLLRSSMIAILAAIGVYAGGWFITAVLIAIVQALLRVHDSPIQFATTRAAITLVPLFIAWHIYCRSDHERQASGLGKLSNAFSFLPADLRSLLWLIIRQGRWLLLIALLVFFISGPFLPLSIFAVWPIGTMIAGITFGLFCFAPEQPEAASFLGAQRFTAGKIWTVKVLFWLVTLALLVWMAWFLAGRATGNAFKYEVLIYFQGLSYGNLFMLVAIWPLYGFSFGVFLGQVTTRPIIAFFLTLMLAPVFAILWLPSLILGGVPFWWVLSIPLILLVTSRLLMRPWLCGRLTATRPLATMFGCAMLIPLSIFSFLMYRPVQIPDAGEPFDVAVFKAELATAMKNEAGPLLREAARKMQEQKITIKQEFTEPKIVKDVIYGWRHPSNRLSEVHDEGWPKGDEELGRWLNRMFEGEWAQEAEKAAYMPLGVLNDPRLVGALNQPKVYPMAEIFSARALQLQASGKELESLDLLETALALSRQVGNFASGQQLYYGKQLQGHTLEHYFHWLRGVGPNKKLLQAGLAALQKHEAAMPDPANTVKAKYLAGRISELRVIDEKSFVGQAYEWSYLLPWEKDRQALLVGNLTAESLQRMNDLTHGKPYRPRDWAHFDYPLLLYTSYAFDDPTWTVAMSQLDLRAAQLVTAIAMYQAEHGKPPDKLGRLAPNYLPALPVNPFDGESFGYRISDGESLKYTNVTLAKGQAVVWADSRWPSAFDEERSSVNYWPVPMWKK